MCGPAQKDEKQKAELEEFSEDFESAFVETFLEHSSILSSAPSSIFSGGQQDISVPETARPRSRRNGSKSRKARWIH